MQQKHTSWDIILIVIICAIESFTKGLMGILLIPASIVTLPLFVFLQLKAKKQFASSLGSFIKFTSYALTVSIICTYVFMAGGGDTQDIVAFGFYQTTTHNMFVMALDKIAYFCFWFITPALFVLLILLLLMTKSRKREEATISTPETINQSNVE